MSGSSKKSETPTKPAFKKTLYEKLQKPCIICGLKSAGTTSYLFWANGRTKIGISFCQKHLDNHGAYGSPAFENQDALERFKKEHPGLYKHYVQDKIIVFLKSHKNGIGNTPE